MQKQEVKPGKSTTEFYIAAGTTISIVVMSLTGIPIPPEVAVGAITAIGSIYTIVRGWIKSSASK